MKRRCAILLTLTTLWFGCPDVLVANSSAQAQVLPLPGQPDSTQVLPEEVARRRVEALLRSGRRDEAVTFLEQRDESQGLEPSLQRRLARIYRDLGRYSDLERLLLEQRESGDPADFDLGSMRMLAEARYALDRPDEARAVLDEMVATDPKDPSVLRLVSNVLTQNGRFEEAIQLLLDARARMGQPAEFAQHLGSLYSQLGRSGDAAREYLTVISQSPMNLTLMRGQILELAADQDDLPQILGHARKAAADNPQIPQLQLVLAELLQHAGETDDAWKILRPLVVEPELLQDLIQMSMAGLADSRLPGASPARSLSKLQLSARVLQGVLISGNLPRSMETRVYETLNRTLLAMLENPHFTVLPPDERGEMLDEARLAIVEMGERYPNNAVTASALLRLANIYVEALHRPKDAIELYQRLYMSPNAPNEQLQMARVGLGRSYIAAGDTTRARELFTDMGKDRSFSEGQGRAHYHLGLLDFMGGNFETAQQRLSSVALEAPTAEYTNDALDLALLLAEQLLSSGGGDAAGLERYGRALYYRAVYDVERMREELQELSQSGNASLAQRSLLDLARHYRGEFRPELALAQLERLDQLGGGRYDGESLELRGDLLTDLGRDVEAQGIYERILLEHESYVMIDGVREKIRALKNKKTAGDLP
jgi:tetratricopeptide (TPR) repeat protein